MSAATARTIDPLAIVKDSLSYTFPSGVKAEIETYFTSIGKNAKAVKVHERDQRKHDRLVAKGKNPDWEVAAAAVIDLDMVKSNITHLIDRLIAHYKDALAERDNRDYKAETIAAIDYLKENASGVVAKVTRRIEIGRAHV